MKFRVAPLILALLSLCAACGRESEADSPYLLYFLAQDSSFHGSALACEPYQPPEHPAGGPDQPPLGQSWPNPGDLLQALVDGPRDPELTSPFPRGLTFQWWEWDADRPGNLRVGMSEQYGGLTDISLTLADYCIVLTLSQLEGVETVEIVSAGYTVNYRSHPLLALEEAELSDPMGK
ncbi:MAG: GerMN domain-containing protein [Lawsonibacter sp.]|nr:GerMN domain-containing protein [Lawsonibacter sp.]